MAALLLGIIKLEKLPLSSIGWYPQKVGKSILWAIVTVCLSFSLLMVCLLIFQYVGWHYGESNSSIKLSVWTVLLVELRAGVVEELFFRGYIIERLTKLTQNRSVAALGSLIPFAFLHYSQGIRHCAGASFGGRAKGRLYVAKRFEIDHNGSRPD